MQVIETFVVEIFVYRIGHGVTDAKHRTERVGTRTQVGDVAQEFERMSLLLQRIGFGIGRTVYLDLLGLHLDALSRTAAKRPGVRPHADRRPVVTRY